MSIVTQIESYVRAHHPLISLATYEERHTDELLVELQKATGATAIREWNYAQGWVDFTTKHSFELEDSLGDALNRKLTEDKLSGFLVLRDAHLAFKEQPKAVAKLKRLVRRIQSTPEDELTIFMISPWHAIPDELEKDAVRFDIPLPGRKEVETLLREHSEVYEYVLNEAELPNIITSLLGLGEQALEQLLNRAYSVKNGNISADDVELFLSEKEQIIRQDSCLKMETTGEALKDVGGLQNLTAWLERKGRIFANLDAAQAFCVDPPKGVLLVGMPGCGKSLCAKATASIFRTPLVRLDFGSVLGKYMGESETNLRRALAMTEAISPCVLWLDELEKAFSGTPVGEGGQAHEVTNRMLGYFLTWLQEKKSPVFVVATANNITLPPELLRRGRFDETFYVTFPTDLEREQILRIHLAKRNKILSDKDMRSIAAKMKDFSGSDIEAVVKEGIETAFLEGKVALTVAHLQSAIAATKPLKEMLPEHIKKCEDTYKSLKIRPAS